MSRSLSPTALTLTIDASSSAFGSSIGHQRSVRLLSVGKRSREAHVSQASRRAIHLVAAFVGLQILLGASVIWWQVPIALALLHQAVGLSIFTTTLVACHRLRHDGGVPP